MPLIGSSEYPQIRAALSVSLSATTLPDATIALDVYAGEAQRWVLAAVPGAESLSGAELATAKRAAVFHAAYLLAPAMPNITAQEMDGLSASQKARDWEQHAATLLGRAQAALGSLVEDAAAVTRPTLFTLAAGGRGRL